MHSYFPYHAGTIYEGTTNIQLTTMAKFIDQEYDQWDAQAASTASTMSLMHSPCHQGLPYAG